MSDQISRGLFEHKRPIWNELKGRFEGEPITAACLLAFAASAAATFLICGLTPVRPVAELWRHVEAHRSGNPVIKENRVNPDHAH